MSRIDGKVLCAAAALALFGCSPALQGVCSADSDCKTDETCSNGICLARTDGGDPRGDAGDAGDAGAINDAGDGGAITDGGDAGAITDAGDAGDAGGPLTDGGATIAILDPDGGFVGGTFRVAAQASAAGTVSFDLAPAVGGASKGAATATATAAGPVESSLTVNDKSFNGLALVQATLHTSGGDARAPSVSILVDQTGPSVSTAFDGTNLWVAADGGFSFTAHVTDTGGSGVGGANVAVMQSSTTHVDVAATVTGDTAQFNVPAKGFAVANAAAFFPFSLTAIDKVGNLTTAPSSPTNVFKVDDQPPVISGVAAIGGPWFQRRVPFTASVSDGAGSGVAAGSIVLTAGSTRASGAFDGGVATFNADFGALTDGGFEGPIAYQVSAKDNVGNTGVLGGTVNVDNVPPSVAVSAVTAADVTARAISWYGGDGGAITIRANIDGGAGSPVDGTSVFVDVGGGLAANPNEPSYSFDIPRSIATGIEGAHTFNVRAADLAGNPSSAPLTLYFDTLPPVLLPTSLVAPTGWVRRAGPAAGSTATVTSSFSVIDNGAGTAAVLLQTADGKTALGTLTSTDDVNFSGGLPLFFTAPGTEGPVTYKAVALDRLQNASTATYQILVDDVPPSIGLDSSNPANTAWHSGLAGNLTFNATAAITDNGSLVGAATMGAASGAAPAGGPIWSFNLTLPSDSSLENNHYGPVTVTATDNVGNTRTDAASFFFKVDNKAPAISGLSLVTAADGVAGAIRWYRGPDNNPPTTTLDLTATITDTYLDPSTLVASVGSTVVATGAKDSSTPDLWHFAIPRSVGKNATGQVILSLNAQDLAGNRALAPSIGVYFDDSTTGSFAPTLSADAAWHPRTDSSGTGLQLPVTATFTSPPPSGVQAVTLSDSAQTGAAAISHSGSTWQFSLPSSDAPAGAEGAYSFSIVATSVVGVTSTATGTRNIDNKPPVIGLDPANLPTAAWHGKQANTLGVTAYAALTDNGSGVAGANMGSGAVAIATGNPPAGGSTSWTFGLTLPADATIETNKYGPITVSATDNVGNSGSDTTSFYFMLDNKPPAWSAVALDAATPGDGTDLAGRHWFKGKAFFAAGAPAITVDATLTEGYLATATATPAGSAAVTGCPGSGPTYSCQFAVPRPASSVSPAAPYQVSLSAADLAGNTAAPTSLGLYIDNFKTLAPSASVDSAVHGPSETVSVTVSVAAPSGLPVKAGAVDLAGAASLAFAGCTAISPDPSSTVGTYPTASKLIFKVPIGTCAPANTDGPVGFTVAANSLVGGTGSTSGSIQVDTRGPVVGAIQVPYPSPTGAASDWSHDGSHFHRRDNGAIFSFSAYDCHGLGGASVSVNGMSSGNLSVTTSVDSSGALNPANTCASPSGVTVTRYTVAANLAQVSTAALAGADNQLGWSATVNDAFGNAGGTSSSINVTRRLWRTSAPQVVTKLALGPVLFATGSGGIDSLDPNSGAVSTVSTGYVFDAMIASNNGTPALVYGGGRTLYASDGSTLASAAFGSCLHGTTLSSLQVTGPSTISYSSQSSYWDGTCDPTCNPVDYCTGTNATCAKCLACHNPNKTNFYVDQMNLSGASATCSSGGPGAGTICAGSPSGPTTLSYRIQSALPSVLYVGQSGNNEWVITDTNGAQLGSGFGAPLAVGHGWPLIDGSSTPYAYLPGASNTPGSIDVLQVSPIGFLFRPFSLPAFPANINDMLIAQSGILYVLSNNIVHAVITDSAGGATAPGGTQASAWPSACRDPCASSNAGYACPY